jgi:anti-sigma factor RsiW
MTDDDAELVALIDNELDESRRTALLARLAADEQLRQRYDELRQAGAPIAASLDALLEQAPLARLRAALRPDDPVRQPSRRLGRIALRELAAGIVIGLLAAGAAAWVALSFGLLGERQDWRTAVVEYTNLYTNETFSPLKPDASLQAIELSALGARVGVKLTPESVALPGLRFTAAFMLSYGGSPLGVIAYVDPSGAPVAFCVIANGGADAPIRTEKRGEFSLADWSRGGRGFLVVGRKPGEQIAEWAQMLEKRI